MAMGRRGQDEAERAFRCHSRYTNSTGSLTATPGSARELGWLRNHPEADRIKGLLSRAEYVVWSYGTPIGFVCSDDDGNIQRFYVDAQHTVTTSHHQTLLRVAWGEYETIGERRSGRARRQPARQVRDDRALVEAVGPGYTEPAFGRSNDRMSFDFSAQDDLMDEVRGWRSPSHP